MNTKRNYFLDFCKGVGAICVVLAHMPFPGVVGSIPTAVGTAGVVLFFLISGYFSYAADDDAACRQLIKRFKRNLVLTLIAIPIYSVFTALLKLISGHFSGWIASFTDPVLYLRMIVMGDFEIISGDPLWFMPALLYSYLILWCIHKFRIKKAAYIAMPILLLLRIGMETYTNSFGADWHMSGNFLVGALPVMLLGHFMAYKKDSFLSLSMMVPVAGCVITAALMFISVNVRIAGLDISQPFKISFAFFAFILALKLPQKKVIAPIGFLGNAYSLDIYLWHYPIGIFLGYILETTNAPGWTVDWCLPIATLAVAIAVSAAIYGIKNNSKNR